jgi:AAA+ ATPase superfamily predicted ATPase
MTSHDFVYGRPVGPGEFLDREGELRTVFNRLRSGECAAVVGEPHIGKSSLLLQLVDEPTQRTYLGDDVQGLMISLFDLQPVPSDYTPIAFWEETLEPLRRRFAQDTTIVQRLEEAAQRGYAYRPLERVLNSLGQQGQRFVLLLDEFERLLVHPNFQDPSFFAQLRSLGSLDGLSFVTASRLSLAEMNELGRHLLNVGSPLFNLFSEVRLRSFDEHTVNQLLDRAAGAFAPAEQRFIRRVAGRHPFLLQAMAASLLETTTGEDRYARAAERFYEQIASHFNDVWYTLDERARTTAVILALVELGQRALRWGFASREIERMEIEHADIFDLELRRLAERDLAEPVSEGWQFDRQHLPLWKGERWTVGAQVFAWWVRDVVITGVRPVPAYDEWLDNRAYCLLLTQEQWDWLVSTVRNAPEWALQGVGGLARELFEELAEGWHE